MLNTPKMARGQTPLFPIPLAGQIRRKLCEQQTNKSNNSTREEWREKRRFVNASLPPAPDFNAVFNT